MKRKFRLTQFFLLALLFSFFYFAILGKSGVLERIYLEEKLKLITEEVERLETENHNLEHRQKALQSEEAKLGEARKYYLLDENAKIIKFKEFVELESEDKTFQTTVPLPKFRNKQSKNHESTMNFLKAAYLTLVGIAFVYQFYRNSRLEK
ncbi:MAG: septum formation initiator family protein [Leptospiraceae bacterium]|nr:septum formation initiator family protein [Leptospiraceae bacterium]